MADEELNSSLEGISETLRGFFLRELTDSELKEILQRNTILVEPLNVTKAVIVDSEEDIPKTVKKEPEVKQYDKAYKYYLELSENMSISDAYVSSTGHFFVKFTGAKRADGTDASSYNKSIQVNISNASQPDATNAFRDVTVSAGNGSDSLNFSVGTPYLVRQVYGDNNAVSWSGIYLKNMSFNRPSYHKITGYTKNVGSADGGVGQGRLDLYTYNADGGKVVESLSASDKALDNIGNSKKIKVNLECNSYNCGLDNPGSGLAYKTLTITFNKPTHTVTYKCGFTDGPSNKKITVYHGASHEVQSYGSTFSNKKAGSTFAGWEDEDGNPYDAGEDITCTSNYTLTAQWELNTYTVKYDLAGGSNSSDFPDQSKNYGENLKLHSGKPTKTGYTFTGWKDSDKDSYSAGGTYKKNKNTTMTAQWTPKAYTVTVNYYRRDSSNSDSRWEYVGKDTFSMNYASVFNPLTATRVSNTGNKSYKNYAEIVVNQNKNDGVAYYNYQDATYRLAGTDDWTNIDTTSQVTMPASDIIVHINFTGSAVTPTPTVTPEPTYNLTVNPNGGTIIQPDGTVTDGTWSKEFNFGEWNYFNTGSDAYANSAFNVCSLPSREGCYFNGWSQNPSSAVIDTCKFSSWWDYHANLKQDVTVTANWTADLTYQYYKYDAASGEWVELEDLMEKRTQSVGTTTELSSIDSRVESNLPDGYEFEKYTVGTVDGDDLSTILQKGKLVLEKHTVVCICYMPKDLNLNIDTVGGIYSTAVGEGNDEVLGLNFTYGKEKAFSSKDISSYVEGGMSLPVKEGYHLCDPENESDVAYVNAHKDKYTTIEPWVIISGTGGVSDDDNYSFNGMSTVDVTIQANWIPNSYKINVDPNGGKFYVPGQYILIDTVWSKSFTYENSTCYAHDYEKACDLNLSAVSMPTREGYKFEGWKQTSGGGTTSKTSIYNYFNGDYVGDVTFTAQWSPNKYQVTCEDRVGSTTGTLLGSSTWDAVFGTEVDGASKGTDTTVGKYYTGYKYVSSTKATVTTSGTKVYRIFNPVVSTLVVDPNGGTWNGSKDIKRFTKSYKETLAIPDPEKPNYTATFNPNGGTCNTSSLATTVAFSTWSKSNPFTAGELASKVFTFGATENGKGTLTAQWVGNYNIKLPTPNEWKGHDFIGWYTASTGGTKVGNAGDTVTISQNVTYYAQWVAHPTKITLSNTVNKSKVCFAKGNPVAIFKVEGTDVMGNSHTFIKTLEWNTSSNNYQSLSFTILSGNYKVTLVNQNEYAVGTPSGSSNVSASGVVANVDISDGSEATVNFTSNENDYTKYTGNSMVTTSLK